MNEPVFDLPIYGDLEFQDAQHGIILQSPDGTRWRVTVDDTGTLDVTEL